MPTDPRSIDPSVKKATQQFLKSAFRSFFILDRDFSHPFSDKFFRILFNEGNRNLFPEGNPATEKQFTRLLNSFVFDVFDPMTRSMATIRLNRVAAGKNRRYLYLNIQPAPHESIVEASGGLVELLSPDHPFRAADPLSPAFLAAIQEAGITRELGAGLRSRTILRWRKETYEDKIKNFPELDMRSFVATNPLFPYAAFLNDPGILAAHHRSLLESDMDKSEKIV